MLEDIDTFDWARYPQPLSNALGEIPTALRALADPTDLDRQRAYHRLPTSLASCWNDSTSDGPPVHVPLANIYHRKFRQSRRRLASFAR